MKLTGLTAQEVEKSRQEYGSNRLTEVQQDTLWQKILEGFKDPMIMILLVALAVQVVLFFLGQAEWFEPVGILIAILIANGVSAVSEYKQEGKATALKAEEEGKEMTKVIRDGHMQEIHVGDVVRGDIIFLQVGDKIPADGQVIEGTIKVDQSSLNGESEEATKTAAPEGAHYDIKDLVNEYYVYRGTVVCGGEAYFRADAVGDSTLFGQLALEAQEEKRPTPLQLKLTHLAKQISTFGYIGAICIMAGIMLKTLLSGQIPQTGFEWIRLIMNAVTVAVTIIVCAVPEGLPMLTSILLSYQSLRMAKDNVLVRKINGLETAGSLSILFSDKTGTITEGHLSVVELTTGGVRSWTQVREIAPSVQELVINGIGVNNGAVVNDDQIFGGNSTDRALMQYLIDQKMAGSVDKEKIEDQTAFDSAKKYSTAVILTGPQKEACTYIKGAPEIILEKCRFYLDEEGGRHELTDRDALTAFIDTQAGRSMRLLAVAYCEGPELTEDLTLITVLSIRDNVRTEVIDAIKEVQGAGIQVVMVTGDRKETAQAIAREARLIESDDDIIITSKEMAAMSDEELKEIMPRLRVVARALPTDKSRLVRIAQSLNLVVGMTGDGVNDAPALKIADVGFAMGSGTEVAKEAGDITILDDNFSSIEKAILYGRTMFKSIRKFLIFQLTVNVAAVLICFIGPLLGENVVLTVIQLLVVNLAMDTLAAIAFGSEPALQEYMKEKPIPRAEPIVTRPMFTEVLISAFYVTIICLLVLFAPWFEQAFQIPPQYQMPEEVRIYLRSAVFALFMMAITFNGFNARTEHINPFEHLSRNRNFLIVMLVIFALQFVFVTFGGVALDVEPLNGITWAICIVLAFLVIPIDMVRKILVRRRG